MAFDRSVDGNSALSRPLEDILSEAGVDSVLGNSLISEGWTTKTFALAATSLSEFKPDSLTAEDVSPLQQACLRVAWQSCQGPSSSSPAASSQSLTAAPSSGSWHESFAPKLTDEVIIRTKSEFSFTQVKFWFQKPHQGLACYLLSTTNCKRRLGHGFLGNFASRWCVRKNSRAVGRPNCRSWKAWGYMNCY